MRCLLLLVMPFFAYSGGPEISGGGCLQKEEKLYLKALKNSDNNDDKAFEKLESCNLNKSEILLKRIQFLYDQENYRKALTISETLIDKKNLDKTIKAKALYYAGCSEFFLDVYNVAIDHLKKAKKLGYENTDVDFKLGRCHYYIDEYEKSKNYYFRVLRAEKDNASAWNNLGLNFEEKGQYKTALSMYFMADSLAEGRESLYKSNIVNNLIEQDRWKEARNYARKAYAKFPKDDELADNYARTLNHFGHHDSAIAISKRIIKNKPSSDEPYFRLGYSFNQKGMQDSALYYYYKDLEIPGTHPVTLDKIADIYRTNGLMDKALKFINRSIKIKPDKEYNQSTKRKILLWQHRYHDCYKFTKRYVKAFPEDESAANFMAYALMQVDSFQKAIPYAKEDLRISPESAIAYNNLGRCYAKTGKHRKALAYFDTAIQKNPDNSFIYHNRASLYAKLGKKEKACRDLKKALEKEYNWAIDSNLLKLRNEYCPEISINRKINYHVYKGNKEHLKDKSFIDILPHDSVVLNQGQEQMIKDSVQKVKVNEGETRNKDFEIYPNPSNGLFKITLNNGGSGTQVKVYNMNSKLIKKRSIKNQNEISLDLTAREAGTYIVFITNSKEVLHSDKIILRN